MAMTIRKAMKIAESGDVWVRNDTEGAFVLFVLSNYAENEYRTIFLSRGKIAVMAIPEMNQKN